MRVLHVSISLGGGAGGQTLRLHQALRAAGVDSRVLVHRRPDGNDDVFAAPMPTSLRAIKRLGRLLRLGDVQTLPVRFYRKRDRNPNAEIFSCQWLPDSIAGATDALSPDIVHLSWVFGGWMQIETLPRLPRPVVWTLNDMWPLTGGCYHSEECTRYQDRCGHCPILHSNREHDLSRWVWNRKLSAWRDVGVTLVAPSTWMADNARRSALFRDTRVEVIPNGQDTRRFRPVDRRLARELLGLPKDKKLLLFGAWRLNNPWKGADLLDDVLSRLARDGRGADTALVMFGHSEPDFGRDMSLECHHLGVPGSLLELPLVYAAADAYLCPSRRDTLPTTVIEAMACGIPTVAFRTSGVPDLVEHRETGYLADAFDTDDFARGIAWVLEDEHRHHLLSHAARVRAVEQFSIERTTERHTSLYEELFEAHARTYSAAGRE